MTTTAAAAATTITTTTTTTPTCSCSVGSGIETHSSGGQSAGQVRRFPFLMCALTSALRTSLNGGAPTHRQTDTPLTYTVLSTTFSRYAFDHSCFTGTIRQRVMKLTT